MYMFATRRRETHGKGFFFVMHLILATTKATHKLTVANEGNVQWEGGGNVFHAPMKKRTANYFFAEHFFDVRRGKNT
jgi:hypothetical protein